MVPPVVRGGVACSPRTRGWTPSPRSRLSRQILLPAHAGMDPDGCGGRASARAAPRARGDGPGSRRPGAHRGYCSPRTRGWTHVREELCSGRGLLPAHAGMDPAHAAQGRTVDTAPRARGDGPRHVERDRLLGLCSPRTRGWTRHLAGDRGHRDLLPAHAGMDPGLEHDGEGVGAAPRARGDGPLADVGLGGLDDCSPRTRGWTRQERGDSGLCSRGSIPSTAPRARGDGPQAGSPSSPLLGCSPRTRGVWCRAVRMVSDRLRAAGLSTRPPGCDRIFRRPWKCGRVLL